MTISKYNINRISHIVVNSEYNHVTLREIKHTIRNLEGVISIYFNFKIYCLDNVLVEFMLSNADRINNRCVYSHTLSQQATMFWMYLQFESKLKAV